MNFPSEAVTAPLEHERQLPGASVSFRPATTRDFNLSWTLYAEAVKPHIAPHLEANFQRKWIDEQEEARFASWWTPMNTFIITHADNDVGWLHVDETNDEITLRNFCVGSKFRRLGIGSRVLEMLIASSIRKHKPVTHSVLKTSGCKTFFERRGFEVVGEDDIALTLRLSVAPVSKIS